MESEKQAKSSAAVISSVAELEDLLSFPSAAAIDAMRRIEGDLIVLGVGGKMGPTLARMAKRASEAAGVKRRVIGVARFSSTDLPDNLRAAGVESIAADLLDHSKLDGLPDVPNVVFMAGMKFGSSGNQSTTWAMNSFLPGEVCRKFSKSKIVAFGTGNVYGMVPLASGGSLETDTLDPVGEYAMSCLGRERIFEYFSKSLEIPMAMIRLNYACELRYGVLVDIAQKVWNGQEIDLSTGNCNVIWQGDANAAALASFAHATSPPFVLNVAGPEVISVRRIATQFGEMLGHEPQFIGSELPSSLLNNSQKCEDHFGYPRVGVQQLVRWIAEWIRNDGPSLGKPTHFQTRDGKF